MKELILTEEINLQANTSARGLSTSCLVLERFKMNDSISNVCHSLEVFHELFKFFFQTVCVKFIAGCKVSMF